MSEARIRAILTQTALQSAGRRRNILWAQCATALNRRQAAATCPTLENKRD